MDKFLIFPVPCDLEESRRPSLLVLRHWRKDLDKPSVAPPTPSSFQNLLNKEMFKTLMPEEKLL